MTVVKKEIKRLKKMPQQSPEYPMLRNYLELVSELPWNKSSMEVIDIQKAKEVYSNQSSVRTLWRKLKWDEKQNKLPLYLIFFYSQDLNAEHYAMNKVKQRILEYLAVRQLNNSLRGPILCFAGPPGVGKTSIGKSIANTIGRKFHR